MLIFQPPVNFYFDKNIQTIFGTKLEDFLNYWKDYNLISQTVEKVVKKIFLVHIQGTLKRSISFFHFLKILVGFYKRGMYVLNEG
jgi:hypothetical protein